MDIANQLSGDMVVRSIGTVLYPAAEREAFLAGTLLDEWACSYTDTVFDANDVAFANAKLKQGKKYFEWKAAVLLHELTGFHALVERYQMRSQVRKFALAERVCGPKVWEVLGGPRRTGRLQGPDLIMFEPKNPDTWLMCETKGPTDSLRVNQLGYFSTLVAAARRPVLLLEFQVGVGCNADWINAPSAAAIRAFAKPWV